MYYIVIDTFNEPTVCVGKDGIPIKFDDIPDALRYKYENTQKGQVVLIE